MPKTSLNVKQISPETISLVKVFLTQKSYSLYQLKNHFEANKGID